MLTLRFIYRRGSKGRCRQVFVAGAVGLLLATAGPAARSDAAEQLRTRVEELSAAGALRIGDATISATAPLLDFYTRRNFTLAWTPESASAWLAWLATMDDEGLHPADYYASVLGGGESVGRGAADRDILLTASLLRAARDLRFGKVDPASLDPSWHLPRAEDWDAAAIADGALASGAPGPYLAAMLPRPRLYLELQDALRRYRVIEADGGWPQLPAGSTLRIGDAGEAVALLRRRLAVTGDAPEPVRGDERSFDADVERAVRTFQARHGLDVDGVVGSQTRAALNVPVGARIDQIRLNLERGRWVFGNLAPRFVVVNTASFQVFVVEHDVPIWSARAVVGRFYRQTPTFRGELEYIVLNPTWTIPPTILREDIVPRAKTDPTYLEEMGIDVLTPEGRLVDPRELDWSRLHPRNFPYTLEQRAGPDNLLGRVKLIFPNPFFVFLHDTPQQVSFSSARRTFSSGCVRVEDALALAELVLDDPSWTRARLDAEVETGRTQTIRLDSALPVLVLYWTASVDAGGQVRFLPDVYERDRRILAALDAPSS